MKKIFISSIFSFSITAGFSQAGMWTWVKGSNQPNAAAVYGTQGIPDAANTPGALYEAAEWTDQAGNFWLFGGLDPISQSNADLWMFSVATNNWTWMKGTGLPNDTGNFGTQGMASPSNNPPSLRWGVATWTGQNNSLWLYGGYAPGIGYMNDLWKYDIATNEWIWVHGAATNGISAVHGTQGIPASSNTPGSLSETSCTWVDSTGNLWLFGGISNGGNLNTLWKAGCTHGIQLMERCK